MLSLDCYQFGWAGNAQKRSESEKVVVVVRWVGGGEGPALCHYYTTHRTKTGEMDVTLCPLMGQRSVFVPQ